jgi:hypothetical protein
MWHLHDGEYRHTYKRILLLITNSNEIYFWYHHFTSLAHSHNLCIKDAFSYFPFTRLIGFALF